MLSPLSKLPANANVAVVGGGVAGLMFTYFLGKLRPDVKINVIEAQQRSGGWIKSWQTKDQHGKPIMLEQGPRTLRGVSDGTVLIIDTLKDLNNESVVQCIDKNSEADKKFLLDTNDKLIQVPNSPLSVVEFLCNPLSKGLVTGLLGESFRKPSSNLGRDESVSSFLSRRLGNDHVGKNILSAIFHGIYGDDIGQMSAKRTLGRLYDLELKYGSITKGLMQKKPSNNEKEPPLSDLLTKYQQAFGKNETTLASLTNSLKRYPMLGLKGGLETFPIAVREAVNNFSNVKFITGEKVVRLSSSGPNNQLEIKLSSGDTITDLNHIRLTPTPANISKMVSADSEKLAKDLASVKANSILLVNYYLPGKEVIPKKYRGFGYLCPQSNKNPHNLLGVIFDSVIEKNLQPLFKSRDAKPTSQAQQYTKLTAMLGGHYLSHGGENIIPSKDVTISAVKDALNTHIGVSRADLDAGLWAFTVADKCLPRFFVGYDEWQSMVEQEIIKTYSGRVSVGGMGFSKGPGVPDVIADGLQDAVKLT